MYTDNSFPLFESIMHGSLDPLAPAMAASSNYEQRILDQIVDAEKDNGIYSISFVTSRYLKEKYYRRLMFTETIAYCNEWLATFAAEDNSDILAYYRDSILDKHLKACMMRLHEKMLDAGLHRQELLLPEKDLGVDAEMRCNAYVLHLLKVCLAKVYLDFQQALLPVVNLKLNEAELYCNYFGEPSACKTWISLKANHPANKLSTEPHTAPNNNNNNNNNKLLTTMPKAYAPSTDNACVAASPAAEPSLTSVQVQDDLYLKVSDVCQKTGLAERTIRKYLSEGKLKGSQPNGQLWVIKQSDLQQFMENNNNSNKKNDNINPKTKQG